MAEYKDQAEFDFALRNLQDRRDEIRRDVLSRLGLWGGRQHPYAEEINNKIDEYLSDQNRDPFGIVQEYLSDPTYQREHQRWLTRIRSAQRNHSGNLLQQNLGMQVDAEQLLNLLQQSRGFYGQGSDYQAKVAARKKINRELYEMKRDNGIGKGKKHRFSDGSVGYGKYRRQRRRGRGAYIIPGILGAAKRIGKNVFGLGRYRRRVRRGRGAYGDSVVDQGVPIFANPESTDGPVTVRNREFIQVVPGSTNFTIQDRLDINPGNHLVFPWLSKIAQNFSQYRFEGLSFHFVSTSGNITNSQALGSITMAVDYDPSGKDIITKQQMLATPFAVSKAPCTDSECPVECAPQQMMNGGLLYIRDLAPANQDLRFFDLGQFILASDGQDSNANGQQMGELWVTYQVALYKPQLASMEEGKISESDWEPSSVYTTFPDTYNPTTTYPWGTWMHWTPDSWSDNPANITTIAPEGYVDKQSLRCGPLIIGAKYVLTLSWFGDVAAAQTSATLFGWKNPQTGSTTAAVASVLPISFNSTTAVTTLGYFTTDSGGASVTHVEWEHSFTPLEETVYMQIPGFTDPITASSGKYCRCGVELVRVA